MPVSVLVLLWFWKNAFWRGAASKGRWEKRASPWQQRRGAQVGPEGYPRSRTLRPDWKSELEGTWDPNLDWESWPRGLEDSSCCCNGVGAETTGSLQWGKEGFCSSPCLPPLRHIYAGSVGGACPATDLHTWKCNSLSTTWSCGVECSWERGDSGANWGPPWFHGGQLGEFAQWYCTTSSHNATATEPWVHEPWVCGVDLLRILRRPSLASHHWCTWPQIHQGQAWFSGCLRTAPWKAQPPSWFSN